MKPEPTPHSRDLLVCQNEHGNFDVLLRLDGGYGREDAVRVAGDFHHQLAHDPDAVGRLVERYRTWSTDLPVQSTGGTR